MPAMTKDQRTSIQHRIETMLRIIELESTMDGEREAAKYTLKVMQDKLKALDVDLSTDGWNITAAGQSYYRLPEGWYGSKYDGYKPLTELNKIFREEIKALRLLGKKLNKIAGTALAVAGSDLSDAISEMPAQIRVSVRKRDNSVYITLKNVPADWWIDGQDYYDATRTYRKAGPELQKLTDALYDLMATWRYDRSDAQVDYFDTNFYPHVEADGHGREEWPYPNSLYRSRGY